MKNVPRILPLVGVAVGGVLAINAMAGAKSLPDLLSGAKAFAEGVADKKDAKGGEEASSAESAGQPAAANAPPPRVCAPSADALAKEAGLSPAELRVLQSRAVAASWISASRTSTSSCSCWPPPKPSSTPR